MAISTFTLARALRAGETVFSGWCSLPYPIVAEMIGREGFAAVTLEAQHGLWDVSALLTGVAAVRQGGAAPMVRVPVGDFALVSRALDFGAEGIIAPMINTAADARAFAAAAKYPPIGERSWGPHRVTSLAGLTDQSVYLREANDQCDHARHDRDPHRARQSARRSSRRRASTGCSSARPTFRSRCRTARASTRYRRMSSGSSIASSPPAQKAGKIPGAFCHTAERARRWKSAACVSSR